MMNKKYLLLCGILFGITNAYAEGVVLSDTYVADEEPFVAPQTSDADDDSGSVQDSYIGQQVKPAVKSTLANDSSDPLFLTPDNSFLSDSYISMVDKKLRFGQFVGYGVNNNLVLHANMLYQWDLSGEHQNKF